MWHRVVLLAFGIGIACASDLTPVRHATAFDAPPVGWTTTATVVNVVDGDTIDVEIRKTMRIRLLDCWAPESRTTDAAEKVRGLAAKKHLKDMIDGKSVVIHIPTRADGDLKKILTLDRVLGRVYLGDSDVSESMVRAGHATKDKQ